MKEYKEVKVEAKNAPTGSYAAGCPVNIKRSDWDDCRNCEIAQ